MAHVAALQAGRMFLQSPTAQKFAASAVQSAVKDGNATDMLSQAGKLMQNGNATDMIGTAKELMQNGNANKMIDTAKELMQNGTATDMMSTAQKLMQDKEDSNMMERAVRNPNSFMEERRRSKLKKKDESQAQNINLIQNNEDSFYITIAVGLKRGLRFLWQIIEKIIKSVYTFIVDWILYPFVYLLLPYLYDCVAFVIILIILIMVILYFVSGGEKRDSNNNIFDNTKNVFKNLVLPDIQLYDKNKEDEFVEKTSGIFSSISNFFKTISDSINDNVINELMRLIVVNPSLDDLGDKNKHIRTHLKEGRCDNIGLIESKDGRYCYEQLDEKHIKWDNKEIPYKLLEQKNMKNKNKDIHYDFYVPNCKGSNLFTREFITSCKDNKRTKFICKL